MKGLAFVLLPLALAGCATSNNPALIASLAPADSMGYELICESQDCAEQWQRAQVWVVKHSHWKIQTATDVLIQTYNPTGSMPTYGFSIMKEPLGNGRYRITMSLSCGNIFGCSPPTANQVKKAFYYYLASGNDLFDRAPRVTGIR